MKLILILLIILHVGIANAQLTGKYRSNFIESSNAACFKTQRAGTVNAGASDKMLISYCNCASIYIADLLNNQLALDIENGIQKINPVWGQMAQKYCQINYSNF